MDTKMRNAVYGLAVGDALGVTYEFRARDTFRAAEPIGGGFHGQPAGTFSDDTSMTLAACESLRAKQGAIDADDMRARFLAWLERGVYAIDGTVFDSSIKRGEPISFPLNGVIAGWTEGLQLMKEGAEYVFYIPSELAYGDQDNGPIPGGSTLIFKVQLIDVNPK